MLEDPQDPRQLERFLAEHATRIRSERQKLKSKLYPT